MGEVCWIKEKEGLISVAVYVQPRASKNEIAGIFNGALKVRLTSPPVEGAANTLLVKFLAKKLGISASGLKIISGETSRRKIVEIRDVTKEEVLAALAL